MAQLGEGTPGREERRVIECRSCGFRPFQRGRYRPGTTTATIATLSAEGWVPAAELTNCPACGAEHREEVSA